MLGDIRKDEKQGGLQIWDKGLFIVDRHRNGYIE